MNNSIYGSLPRGRKNAVSAESLCTMHGLCSTRKLRQQVQRERMEGAIIASTEDGYFIPSSREELLRYVHRSEAMAKSIYGTLRAARAALRDMDEK